MWFHWDIAMNTLFFWLCHTACGILVLQPGFKCKTLAVKAGVKSQPLDCQGIPRVLFITSNYLFLVLITVAFHQEKKPY